MSSNWEQRICDGIAGPRLKLPNAAQSPSWSARMRRKIAGALIRLARRIR